MHRVLILGGGFGGIAAALALRQKLAAQDEVVLVERRSHFMVGFRKTWALLGRSSLDAGRRPIAALERRSIRVAAGEVTAIDPANRSAEVDGRRIEADALLVALGAELGPEQVPGLPEHGHNVYGPQQVPPAAEAIQRFGGGRLVVGIFGAPYKCPPAPYELALLLHEHLVARGVSAQLEVFTPQPMSIPLLGPRGCSALEGRLAERGIGFLPGRKASAVEAGQVVFANERRPFDLLLAVPPHRCPSVVVESGLAQADGWVEVDPRTMETRSPAVYAIGDVTQVALANQMPLPKAGVFAEAEGELAAERIAASLIGRPTEAVFEGVGHCFMEVGHGQAVLIRGRFLAEPLPQVEVTEPSAEYLAQKHAFEVDRLERWFGR